MEELRRAEAAKDAPPSPGAAARVPGSPGGSGRGAAGAEPPRSPTAHATEASAAARTNFSLRCARMLRTRIFSQVSIVCIYRPTADATEVALQAANQENFALRLPRRVDT